MPGVSTESKNTTAIDPNKVPSPSLIDKEGPWELPVLPVRGSALFPHSMAALTVGRPKSLNAIKAMDESHLIGVFAQRDPTVEAPAVEDLYAVGCAGLVLRLAKTGEGDQTLVAFIEGVRRVRLRKVIETEPILKLSVDVLEDECPESEDAEYSALKRNITELFQEIVEASPKMSSDVLAVLRTRQDASAITDFVANALSSLAREVSQELLETLDVRARMKRLVQELLKEREELRMRDKIRAEVGKKISEAQRQAVLREQLKVIEEELGEGDETTREVDALRQRLREAGLPEEAQKEADRELERLKRIPPASPEYSVARSYLDWLVALPWKPLEVKPVDLRAAREILDADHYDLDKIKERILEHIAVVSLKTSMKGPILCFVGPPGVGKTSIGQSIARAMGRSFVRLSLGGMRDEAEIRGHRRTYIGALPGQIIRSIRRAGARDTVFMLDEVDKLGKDFRGDPASALLEVLDPEQNNAFRDHYLDVPFDLSGVVFITTANLLEPVPTALRDRMEVLELPGYADEEKAEIARRYLVPQQSEAHGLRLGEQIEFRDDAIREIVTRYTHEAGVRELERKVAAICRKQAKQILEGATQRLVVSGDVVHKLLGPPRFFVEEDVDRRMDKPGVAIALAWTPYGGEILFVEVARVLRDKGEFTITGQVQKVMEESTRAALTWLRANSDRYGIDPKEFHRYDVHVHVPAGAVPKDGPSAGIVMVTALVSLFTQQPVRRKTALSGEITLSGSLLPVGGIKEKVLAAKRSGIGDVLLPEQNRADVAENIPESLREGMHFHFAETIDDALSFALGTDVPESGLRTAVAH